MTINVRDDNKMINIIPFSNFSKEVIIQSHCLFNGHMKQNDLDLPRTRHCYVCIYSFSTNIKYIIVVNIIDKIWLVITILKIISKCNTVKSPCTVCFKISIQWYFTIRIYELPSDSTV